MAKPKLKQKSTAEVEPSQTKDEIIKESKRIEESTLYSAKGHFVAARFWSYFHLIIGVPIVIISAVAGLSILSQIDKTKTISGILTISVTALSALMTFLNPNNKSNSHLNCGNSYDALNNKVRIFRTIDCWKEKSEDVLTEKLKYFSEQKDKLNTTSPQVPWFAYQLAKRQIASGQADFVVDKESLVQE